MVSAIFSLFIVEYLIDCFKAEINHANIYNNSSKRIIMTSMFIMIQ